jgi:hypothetical protein
MRMVLPGVRTRRSIDQRLSGFFQTHREADFRHAIGRLSRFYRLPSPRVEWFEYLDWGKTAGRCCENGTLLLMHPEAWKRGRKYRSERRWINMIYHELGHYVLWADPERKADVFASRFVRGVQARRRCGTQRLGSLSRPRLRRRRRRSRSR